MFYAEVKGNCLWKDQGYFGGLLDHTHPFPLFLSALPLYNTSLLSLHLPCVPSAAVDHWGPSSQQAAARWSIMSLIGGMSEMATKSKGRKQRQWREKGVRRWREWRKERETERQKEKGSDLFSLEEGVSILQVRSKLGWQENDKFRACVCVCLPVYVWACQSKGFW